MHKTRILIVDDDNIVLKYVRTNLQSRDYETLVAMDGDEALEIIEKELPDLIILDIMIPKINGFEICRRVREWSQIPIIMLSAKHELEDKVKCLNSGADDYVTKPFGVNELVARIMALLRRTEASRRIPVVSTFTNDGLKINFAQRQVTVAGREVKLTPTEYMLIQEFALNSGKVLTHNYLLSKVWGPEYREEREYLHVFIGRLRREIEPDTRNPKYIITVPGVGYKFQVAT